MDVGYLKLKIDIRTEYEEYRSKYNYARKELKRAEVKKIFEGFKDFFRNDGNFKFKSNDHSITAEYKNYGVTLDVDIYKNTERDDFAIEGIIKTYDKEVYEFTAEGIPNKEIHEAPYVDDNEKLINETNFLKAFLDGTITYTFRYKVKGRETSYGTMQEMMLAL